MQFTLCWTSVSAACCPICIAKQTAERAPSDLSFGQISAKVLVISSDLFEILISARANRFFSSQVDKTCKVPFHRADKYLTRYIGETNKTAFIITNCFDSKWKGVSESTDVLI